MTSYSEYLTDLDPWFEKNLGKDFHPCRTRINLSFRRKAS